MNSLFKKNIFYTFMSLNSQLKRFFNFNSQSKQYNYLNDQLLQ